MTDSDEDRKERIATMASYYLPWQWQALAMGLKKADKERKEEHDD